MAKFGLFFKNSPEKLLENFKFLLDNFHTQNIDITCHFLESCGRYLAATLEEEDRANFNSMLDLMWRLKEKDVISSIQLNHIEQTFAICWPQPKSVEMGMQQSNLNQLERFVRYLIQSKLLEEKAVEWVNEILVTRIPLQLCYNFLVSELLLTIILQAKISDMRMLVLLLKSFKADKSGKAQILRAIVTEVMDTVFEEILRSMERNDFKES